MGVLQSVPLTASSIKATGGLTTHAFLMLQDGGGGSRLSSITRWPKDHLVQGLPKNKKACVMAKATANGKMAKNYCNTGSFMHLPAEPGG